MSLDVADVVAYFWFSRHRITFGCFEDYEILTVRT